MGMFTSVIDPRTGIEYQIKCGWDKCETFKVGDKVPSKVYPEYPNEGYLLDDVYDGCNYPQKDVWVIIKDSTIVAIEQKSEIFDDEQESDYDRLRKKYHIQDYPRNLWNGRSWRQKEERDAKFEKEYQEFLASIAHLPEEERLGQILAQPIRRMMNYQSVARKAFKIEKIEIK